ncbi:aspartate aminotransferase family protein [Cohnella panacarvi]|uniref:class-III pyridoxal-phosphate-dependent aminotransferase n=1 Tax=Cohnella panacarvi TaxID=400776 RepID=UPI00047A5611|nr:aspartate aminotransferase family protein [Cohnella panacarvi]
MLKTSSYLEYLANNTWPDPSLGPAVKGEGIYFWDTEGNRFADYSSQTLNVLLGQCHPAIVAAVVEQARTLTYISSRFSSVSFLEASKLIVELAPKHLTKVNIKMCDGSDANEAALKIAKKFTGKSGIISYNGGHTGQTTQTIHIRGYARDYNTLLGTTEDVVFIDPPSCDEPSSFLRSLEQLHDAISKHGNIAAVFVDPIMANAGVLVDENTGTYLKEIQRYCRENDILFIIDENQSFGWMPGIFATNYYGIEPDIVTLGKGLSAGHPLAGVLLHDKLKAVLDYNEADFTNGGHPISCAAAVATLTTLKSEEFDILGKESEMIKRLEKLKNISKVPIRTRGVGLIHSIVISVGSKEENLSTTKGIYNRLLRKGAFFRLYENRIVIKPPIIITYEQIEELFAILEECFAS